MNDHIIINQFLKYYIIEYHICNNYVLIEVDKKTLKGHQTAMIILFYNPPPQKKIDKTYKNIFV